MIEWLIRSKRKSINAHGLHTRSAALTREYSTQNFRLLPASPSMQSMHQECQVTEAVQATAWGDSGPPFSMLLLPARKCHEKVINLTISNWELQLQSQSQSTYLQMTCSSSRLSWLEGKRFLTPSFLVCGRGITSFPTPFGRPCKGYLAAGMHTKDDPQVIVLSMLNHLACNSIILV